MTRSQEAEVRKLISALTIEFEKQLLGMADFGDNDSETTPRSFLAEQLIEDPDVLHDVAQSALESAVAENPNLFAF